MIADLIVTWRPRRLTPVTYCEACGQSMPADHEACRAALRLTRHISSEAVPEAPGTAPDHPEGITS